MNTGTINSTFVVGGIAFSGSVTKSAEGQIGQVVSLPAGVAGTIDASGINGLVTGHGIAAGKTIDYHWTDATDGSHKVRRGLLVDVSNANDIDFDAIPAGIGDAAPANGTAVIVSVQSVITTAFTGDLVLMMDAKADQQAFADIRSSGASELALKFAKDGTWSWTTGQGFTNPLAGDSLTEVRVSNGSIIKATFYLGVLYNSVP